MTQAFSSSILNIMTRVRLGSLVLSVGIFSSACTAKTKSTADNLVPVATAAIPVLAGTVPPVTVSTGTEVVVQPAPAVPAPVVPAPIVSGTTAAPTATPYTSIKCAQFTGTNVTASPLPEMDGNWKLDTISCVAGTLLPAGSQAKTELETKKLERRMSIKGSAGTFATKKIADVATPQNFCGVQSKFVLSFVASDVEMRFDKAPWTPTGAATGCVGEAPAESWISTVCVTGTSNNILVVVRNENAAFDKYCSDNNSKLVFARE